jgi:hypothetical protein
MTSTLLSEPQFANKKKVGVFGRAALEVLIRHTFNPLAIWDGVQQLH